MSIIIKGKQSKAVVTEKTVKGTESVVHLDKGMEAFAGPVANVGVNATVTKNMGDFNSIKLGVSVNMPCFPEDIDATYEKAKSWVYEKMDQLSSEADEDG